MRPFRASNVSIRKGPRTAPVSNGERRMLTMMIPAIAIVLLCQGCSMQQRSAGASCCSTPPPGGTSDAPAARAVMNVELLAAAAGHAVCRGSGGAGVPASTVKSRVQRARQRLREHFDRCCAIELDGRGLPHDFKSRGGSEYPCCGDCACQ